MPMVNTTVAAPNTRLMSDRVRPSAVSSGLSSTLKAYIVPNGTMASVAVTNARIDGPPQGRVSVLLNWNAAFAAFFSMYNK